MKQGEATVADAWRPTSELERRLDETVRAGDHEGYFRLLADSELVIPVPPELIDDVLAGQAQPTWPTREEDGRTHVLAYTSPDAMRACLGPAYRHFLRLTFADLAQSWPHPGWWLAIDAPAPDAPDAAPPIEGRLPSWFVRQIAEGDPRPPRVGRRTASPAAAAPAADAPAADVPAADFSTADALAVDVPSSEAVGAYTPPAYPRPEPAAEPEGAAPHGSADLPATPAAPLGDASAAPPVAPPPAAPGAPQGPSAPP
ncbi:SseB family protein, partial [Actinomadura keratinilytica]|uniref:SseB family protein n=1 Tax=Actinomadura keratinilytica TaxID=547461 RepID=UPI0031EFDFF8